MPAFRRRLIGLCAASCLVLPASAHAAIGDYHVNVPSTTNFPGWGSYASGGPYLHGKMTVSSGAGTYVGGSHRRWRLPMPHASLRIAGGRITGRSATPNSNFVIQVRQGSGGAVRTILSSAESPTFDRQLTADHDWVEFGLATTGPTTAGSNGGNWITVHSLSLIVKDIVNPALTLRSVPAADAWHGRGCASYRFTATDAGSGVSTTALDNITSGRQLTTWRAALEAGLQPGTASTTREGCITGANQHHGSNAFRVTATDHSGRTHAASFKAKFDLEPPVVTTTIAEGATYLELRPELAFEALDDASGIERLEARIDGTPVASVPTGGAAHRIVLDQPLTVGRHVLELVATDNVGNSTTLRRNIAVGDMTPPVITLVSPASHGQASPWLAATAADEASAIDPTSWRVRINGAPLPVVPVGNTISGPVGLLMSGAHMIEVSVADVHGNRAVHRSSYTVEGVANLAGGAPIGGRSGIFVAGVPTAPVRYGRTVRITTTLARNGRPIAGHRVQIAAPAGVTASDVTDVQGVAELRFTPRRSGEAAIWAQGTGLGARRVRLRVAPRIGISVSTSRPRRGTPVTITGRVTPAVRGRVALQARIDGSWYPLRRSVAVDSSGRFRTTVTSAVPGEVAVRVRRPATPGWAPGYSNVRVLHVQR